MRPMTFGSAILLFVLTLPLDGQEAPQTPKRDRKSFCDVMRNLEKYDGRVLTLVARIDVAYHGITLSDTECHGSIVLWGVERPPLLHVDVLAKDRDKTVEDFLAAISATRSVLGMFHLSALVAVTGWIDVRSELPGHRVIEGDFPGVFLLKTIRIP